jgi:nucleotide-binding universal stress UspA family protein
MRWSSTFAVLTSAEDLDGVIVLGFDPDDGPEVRRALAVLAPTDHLAARTLLQGLLGGLCNLAHRVGRDDDAVDDIVRLAWERIRTYPVSRPGSVSANVLLDVRKRYRREQDKARRQIASCVAPEAPSAQAFLEELVSASSSSGISEEVLATILRSRVGGESMADLAAEQQVTLKVLWHRRWRAEGRLRELPLAS